MTSRHALLLLVLVTVAVTASGQDAPRLNFIFMIVDDVSHDDLGCYGNARARTPHLDRLAREGRVFDNAYLTISSCSPSRCSIITGRYPHNTGAPELHTRLPKGQKVFPAALRAAGYHTALSGKHHMGKNANVGFDVVDKGKGPGKQRTWVDLLKTRPKDQPFFFWFASTDAHRNWKTDDRAPTFQPKDVVVPPFLVDGPVTRQDLTGYYHEVSRTDHYVGAIRAELERQRIADHTVIVYVADNGRPFPRCKTRLYDSGIKTPLIVWSPKRIRPGRTSSLVSAIDLAATFLDLAGLPKMPTVQGTSFKTILDDPAATVRHYAFAEHNWHVYRAHERMVRTGPWLYIRNAWPDHRNLCKESDRSFPAGKELWDRHAAGKLLPAQSQLFQIPAFREELYDVTKDPHQLHNLAPGPEHGDALSILRIVLDRWADETADSIPANPTPDRDTIDGKRIKGFRRGEMPGGSTGAAQVNASGPVQS
ncbi:MAG: heparan N-sulfatase [Planctomycetes bacterium]|nr:heparan N-sulfatase [Planctomycetota bacterium]